MGLFCINKEIIYDPRNSSLSPLLSEGAPDFKLDYLESIALDLLISKENQLVKYEEFFSNWRSSEVTENSLSRVISMLRKKLKQAGLTDSVIINTAKKGYTLVALIENNEGLAIDVFPRVPSKNKFNFRTILRNKKSLVITIIVTHTFLLITALILLIYKDDEIEIGGRETSVVELLSNMDIKIELSYNVWSDKIAYTKKTVGSKYWEIDVLNRYDGKKINIKKEGYSLSKAAWLGPHTLVYRQFNEKECSIQKAILYDDARPPDEIKLFPCNPNSYASSIAKFGKDKLLITGSLFNDTSASLFVGDLRSGVVKKVEIDNGGGAGFYNVVTTSNSKIVALLSSPDGVKYRIQLVDPSNDWEDIWSIELETMNFSAGWDGSSLSFKNDKGGISVVDFKSDKEANRVNIPLLSPAYNISTAKRGIMLTSGEFFSQDITYFDDSNGEVINLTAGTQAINKNALFYEKSFIFYISNRTGLNQIWSYNIVSKKSKQISKFTIGKNITEMAVDYQNQMLALQVGDNIELYSVESMEKVLSTIKGVNPEFFSNLLLYSYDGNVRSLSLKSLQPADLWIDRAESVKEYKGELYYSKQLLPGIWRHNEDGEDVLFLKSISSSYPWFIGGDKILFRNDIGNYFQFEFESRELSEFKNRKCNAPIALSKTKCLSVERGNSESRLLLIGWD